jgi:phytoene desaturase
MRIIVIGSGFGGLTAAVRLQAQGHDVTVLERRDKPGGRAYVYEQDGFTFDGGPTIITAPVAHPRHVRARRAEGRRLRAPRPGRPVLQHPLHRRLGVPLRRRPRARDRGDPQFNPDDVEGYLRFAEGGDAIFKTGFELIDKPFLKLADMARVLPDLVRLRADRSVASYVNRFIKDERLRRCSASTRCSSAATRSRRRASTRSSTRSSSGGGCGSRWAAPGRSCAPTRGCSRSWAASCGSTSTSTDRGRRGERRATGVRLADGTRLGADAVVSNADVASTYMKMVDPAVRPRMRDAKLKRMKYSMSLFVIYFGTDRRYENMAHHEILMGPRYKGLLDEIFTRKTLAEDFSLYLHRPTATDPSLRPPGCDSWYVLSPVPHLGGKTDWREAAPRYRDAIVAHLERHYMPGLSRHIVSEHRIDPLHFEGTLNSYLGSAFSVEPTLTQSAWMRPHNRSEDIPNLYFAGAGTHPGAGAPGGDELGEDRGRPDRRAEAPVMRPAPVRSAPVLPTLAAPAPAPAWAGERGAAG